MIDTVNRVLLLVLGLLLVAAGGGALLTATDTAATVGLAPIRPLGPLYGDVAAAVASAPAWWQAGLLVGAVVVALIGTRLLIAELRPPRRWRRGELNLSTGAGGSTTLDTRAVSQAVAQDLTSLRQVSKASVSTSRPGSDLEVNVRLSLTPGTELSDLEPDLDAVFGRLRRALSTDDLSVRLHVSFDGDRPPRVV